MRPGGLATSSAIVQAHAADLQALFLEAQSVRARAHTHTHTSPSNHIVDIFRDENYKTLVLNDNYDGNLCPPLLVTTKPE